MTAQSTWKKSTASMVKACVRRNCCHVVSVCRFGAEGIFRLLRTRRGRGRPVAELEQLALDPLVTPEVFSVASRSISAMISALTGGWPVRYG